MRDVNCLQSVLLDVDFSASASEILKTICLCIVRCWMLTVSLNLRNTQDHPPLELAWTFSASENVSGDTEVDKEGG